MSALSYRTAFIRIATLRQRRGLREFRLWRIMPGALGECLARRRLADALLVGMRPLGIMLAMVGTGPAGQLLALPWLGCLGAARAVRRLCHRRLVLALRRHCLARQRLTH